MPTTVLLTFFGLIFSLFAVSLYIFNRTFLGMKDQPWKRTIQLSWPAISFVTPVVLLCVFFSTRPVQEALSWSPNTYLSSVLFFSTIVIILFGIVRFLIWFFDFTLPDKPDGLIEEYVSFPLNISVPSRLPRGMRRLETTGTLALVHREVAVTGLASAFDGLTIAHLSDIHLGNRLEMENYLEGVVSVVETLDPDLVIFSGDFVDHRRDIALAQQYVSRFKGRLGTFFVLGNHDYWTNADRLKEAFGKTHLKWLGGGDRRVLKRAGRRLILTGTDYPWDKQQPDWKRLCRRETGDAVILAVHTPDLGPIAAKHGASLVLSGHNHGGQICLPFFGPFLSPSRYGVRYSGGVYRVGVDSILNVSKGIGVSEQGIRILCHPEVNFLTLRAPVVEVMAGNVIPARSILRPVSENNENPDGILANRGITVGSRAVHD